jgi:hypothetical protein
MRWIAVLESGGISRCRGHGGSAPYRRAEAASPDAIGHVAHWGGEAVTLHGVMVHKIADLQRHAGHADILRELLDGSVGLLPGNSNLPRDIDWSRHTQRLKAIADRFD